MLTSSKMKKTLILVLFYTGLAATSDLSGYQPRGWRPNGPRFNPNNNRLHAYYGAPGLQSYEPANTATTRDPLSTSTTTVTTTPRTAVTVKTTTARSREPTTEPNEQPEDFDSNPALAIANSFAFNRPIYVYNTFPFLPAQIIA
ncbi:uncharacterized protein LOC109860096 [Pseudomyrmex gracilis]|uniref:uncharacterized protein LOC109860096 n=1 Tax=Pseudomyrmex gracilis TaxID=219809 RepID=UPI000994C352|nr:uncharacterized protein LOC109860096 [Pseudomyrmex gracilis]